MKYLGRCVAVVRPIPALVIQQELDPQKYITVVQ